MSHPKDLGSLITMGNYHAWLVNDSFVSHTSMKNSEAIESKMIKSQTADGRELNWRLRFYPKGMAGSKYGCASVQLVSMNRNKVSVRFRLITKSGCIDAVREYNSGPTREIFPHSGWERGERDLERSLIIDEKSGLLKNYSLFIDCELNESTWESDVEDGNDTRVDNQVEESACWVEDIFLKKGARSRNFGDIQIQVNGQLFQAHRTLLGSQSELFAEALNKIEDKNQNLVVIDKMNDRVFLEVLRFIYFNRICNVKMHASGLLAVAKKYSMEPLKEICEETLSKNIDSEEAVRYLALAERFELKELRKQTIDFIASNFKAVMKTFSYNSLKNMKNDLLLEVIEALAVKIKFED